MALFKLFQAVVGDGWTYEPDCAMWNLGDKPVTGSGLVMAHSSLLAGVSRKKEGSRDESTLSSLWNCTVLLYDLNRTVNILDKYKIDSIVENNIFENTTTRRMIGESMTRLALNTSQVAVEWESVFSRVKKLTTALRDRDSSLFQTAPVLDDEQISYCAQLVTVYTLALEKKDEYLAKVSSFLESLAHFKKYKIDSPEHSLQHWLLSKIPPGLMKAGRQPATVKPADGARTK
jgi:hypothetical protein